MIERSVSSINARHENFHRYEYKHDYTAREDIALLVRQLLGVSESPMDWTHFDRSTDHSIAWEEEGKFCYTIQITRYFSNGIQDFS